MKKYKIIVIFLFLSSICLSCGTKEPLSVISESISCSQIETNSEKDSVDFTGESVLKNEDAVKKPSSLNILTESQRGTLNVWSMEINDKQFYAKNEKVFSQDEQSDSFGQEFNFYYIDKDGTKTSFDIPVRVFYQDGVFQGFPVDPYPLSEVGNALAFETPYGIMVVTSDSRYYEAVNGADGYNYYLLSSNNQLIRLNTNLQKEEIAFDGTFDFATGEIFYLQSRLDIDSRDLYSVDLSSNICQKLISQVSEYVLTDNIFFTKYSATVPEAISDEFRGNVGVGLYEYNREDSSVYEILPSSEYVTTSFIASENHLFINVYEYEGNHSKSILFDRKSETFIEFDQTFLFPVFAEEGVLCSLDYAHSKQALISYDGEVAIWEN